jgi:hypothetical protein
MADLSASFLADDSLMVDHECFYGLTLTLSSPILRYHFQWSFILFISVELHFEGIPFHSGVSSHEIATRLHLE